LVHVERHRIVAGLQQARVDIGRRFSAFIPVWTPVVPASEPV
jgi:hypothetical protein